MTGCPVDELLELVSQGETAELCALCPPTWERCLELLLPGISAAAGYIMCLLPTRILLRGFYGAGRGGRTVTLRKDRFDASEQDFYEALYTQSQAQFGEYITAGTVLNNYAHVFELLIRLRQARAKNLLGFQQ